MRSSNISRSSLLANAIISKLIIIINKNLLEMGKCGIFHDLDSMRLLKNDKSEKTTKVTNQTRKHVNYEYIYELEEFISNGPMAALSLI